MKKHESVEHDLVCPDCGALEIYNDSEDPNYYHCSNCGNYFHEDSAVEYCQYHESVDSLSIKMLNEELKKYINRDEKHTN